MQMGRMFAVVMLGGLASTGCGGDDDVNPAVEKCDTFGRTWCGKGVGCLVSLGTLTESQRAVNLDVCVDTAFAAARCKNAIRTSGTYDQCLTDINAMPCESWNVPQAELGNVNPPATCQGVILVSQ